MKKCLDKAPVKRSQHFTRHTFVGPNAGSVWHGYPTMAGADFLCWANVRWSQIIRNYCPAIDPTFLLFSPHRFTGAHKKSWVGMCIMKDKAFERLWTLFIPHAVWMSGKNIGTVWHVHWKIDKTGQHLVRQMMGGYLVKCWDRLTGSPYLRLLESLRKET